MKKLSILVMAIVAFSVSTYASSEYNVLWSLNSKKTFETISSYVGTTPEQEKELRNIFYASSERLRDALVENNKEGAEKALNFNLANVKIVLEAEQYRKYLKILNLTYNQQRQAFSTEDEQ
ncbi:MAG: hypothetical protein ACK5KT_11125 [Dysgonomonas sp.]